MEFQEWVAWWNRNYKIPVSDRVTIVLLSITQKIKGAREFNKFITKNK